MPRAARVWFPGAWYHVMARGNNKGQIFFRPTDYAQYLHRLRIAAARYECRIHAYALMTNHVHLMVETGENHPIGKLIQSAHTAYTRSLHCHHGWVGHVFQGRYKALVIDRDEYALTVSRYIHLNPVEAGLVSDPLDYPWSSLRTYVHGRQSSLVETSELLGLMSGREGSRAARYKQFVFAGLQAGKPMMPASGKLSTGKIGV